MKSRFSHLPFFLVPGQIMMPLMVLFMVSMGMFMGLSMGDLNASEAKPANTQSPAITAAKSFLQAFTQEDLDRSLYFSRAPFVMGKLSHDDARKPAPKIEKELNYFKDREEQRDKFKKIFRYKSKLDETPERSVGVTNTYFKPAGIKKAYQVVRLRILSGKRKGDSVDIYVTTDKRPKVVGMIKWE